MISSRFCISALQEGKSQLLLERPVNPSSKLSEYFPSPTELIKAQNSALVNQTATTKAESYNKSLQKQSRILPFNENSNTEEDEGEPLNFSTPNILKGSTSSRNAIERHFSINLGMYGEESSTSFQNGAKAMLMCEESSFYPNDDVNHWGQYPFQTPLNGDFNDFDLLGNYFITPSNPLGEGSYSGVPSDSKLLKVIHSNSQNSSLSESTIDKTPQGGNEMSITFFSNSGSSRVSRRIKQPNRFEKSLDQTLILENEFKKSTSWSKQKMQELAQALGLTVSQVYKWNWDRRQSNSYHYFKLCTAPIKPRKQLFSVIKVARDRKGQDSALFSVSKKSPAQQ